MQNKKDILNKLKNDTTYQLEYASGRQQMYDKKSRQIKGERMIALFSKLYTANEMRNMTVLDIGGSTGIIDMVLAKHFKKVICSDIDKGAIEFAKKKFKMKNLSFVLDDIMKSNFGNNTFDIIICTHVYEHVPNQKKLFLEIGRLLKKNGICYLAATNKLQLIEPHYDLPFLSLLPKSLADKYMRITGKGKRYFETPQTYWFLKNLTSKFTVTEYTDKILRQPKKYGYHNSLVAKLPVRIIIYPLSPIARFFSPTFIWLLKKN